MAFCNPCVRPANSSIVNYNQRPTNSIKALLRRHLFKKTVTPTISRPPIHRTIRNHSQTNTRFQRIKGCNMVREVNPVSECSDKTESVDNYDMSIFHDDELDSTRLALSRRQSKQIPRWARKSQLQLAIVNQIYFHEKSPEDIFGSIQMDLVHQMVQSIEFETVQYSLFPPNFV